MLDKENKFVVNPDGIEELGYLGKDGQYHKDLPPELRAELPVDDTDDDLNLDDFNE